MGCTTRGKCVIFLLYITRIAGICGVFWIMCMCTSTSSSAILAIFARIIVSSCILCATSSICSRWGRSVVRRPFIRRRLRSCNCNRNRTVRARHSRYGELIHNRRRVEFVLELTEFSQLQIKIIQRQCVHWISRLKND